MNYYIQGNEDKADKIKAAFEKLGYDTSGHLFNAKSVLYFTLNGEIRATTCNCTPAIIKTHPDYKELELPIKPKFEVEDWIVGNEGVFKITQYEDKHWYDLTAPTGCVVHFVSPDYVESNFHLWSIEDAKDGDVLANDHHILILKELVYDWSSNGTPYSVKAYCGIKPNGNFEIGKDNWCFCGTLHIHPATKEQHDLLFAKMKEAGYQWNVDKKELRKIQPHYGISNFKPFDKVLVRDADDGKWRCNWFSHYSGDGGVYRFVTTKCGYAQCIPFDGNEHLLGTTDMCDEMYINW